MFPLPPRLILALPFFGMAMGCLGWVQRGQLVELAIFEISGNGKLRIQNQLTGLSTLGEAIRRPGAPDIRIAGRSAEVIGRFC